MLFAAKIHRTSENTLLSLCRQVIYSFLCTHAHGPRSFGKGSPNTKNRTLSRFGKVLTSNMQLFPLDTEKQHDREYVTSPAEAKAICSPCQRVSDLRKAGALVLWRATFNVCQVLEPLVLSCYGNLVFVMFNQRAQVFIKTVTPVLWLCLQPPGNHRSRRFPAKTRSRRRRWQAQQQDNTIVSRRRAAHARRPRNTRESGSALGLLLNFSSNFREMRFR